MKTLNDKKGFTLIELLLVLFVTAALLTAGIPAYQQKMQNEKIERAALQVQTWLQSGLAYRLNSSSGTNNWPTSTDLINKNYIKSYSNPWRYCDQNNADNCFKVSTEADSNNFIVELKIPTDVPNAVNIAQLIANRLPNATVINASGSDISVLAQVPPPVFSNPSNQQMMITNIQTVRNDDYDHQINSIDNPKPCPAGMESQRFYSLSEFGMEFKGAFRSLSAPTLWSVSTNAQATGENTSSITPALHYTYVDLDPKSWIFGKNSYYGKILVIDACFPQKSKSELPHTKNANLSAYRY
ncbi:MAG: hypothetical protein LEGION0398_MBIBDBAK_00416 [Legionellaceae bacterium]